MSREGKRSMGPELLEVHPQELTFVFELKKQSADSIQLSNNSDQYIAFKVKTTSPKKYCVRPNIGIIKPKSTTVFTVTMQAQREAPPYMQCKDKFLVQSTIVPYGTKEEDISSELFSKNSGKYIEEKKLRVVLISSPPDAILANGSPMNGSSEKSLKHDRHSTSGLNMSELIYKDEDPAYPTDIKTSVLKLDEVVTGFSKPKNGDTTMGTKIDETTHATMNMDTTFVKETVNSNSLHATMNMDNENARRKSSYQNAEAEKLIDLWTKPQTVESRAAAKVDISANESMKFGHDASVEEQKAEKTGTGTNSENTVEALKSKLISMNMQLNKSENTITKLEEEQNKAIKEIEMLKQELALLRKRTNSEVGQVNSSVGQAYDGFPLLFVVMVALVSLLGGYLLRP